jgi:hypothetical protein
MRAADRLALQVQPPGQMRQAEASLSFTIWLLSCFLICIADLLRTIKRGGRSSRSENLLRDLGMDTPPQIALYAHGRRHQPQRIHDWGSMPPPATASAVADEAKLSIGFINWAHALDHYVMLIFPTVVIGLEIVYGRSYAELIALGTPAFLAFGVFSLPAGWLGDRWSRRNMMALFYAGCGLSLVAAGLAPNLVVLAVALTALGLFAAIYHPVGTAMLIQHATLRGRSLAFNGVCGNLGAALAAGATAALVAGLGWRAAFLVPGVICVVTAVVYLRLVPDEKRKDASRGTVADVPLGAALAATIFGLFVVIALCAGLVFNIVSVALPKIVDERLGSEVPLVGGVHVRRARPDRGRPAGGEIPAAPSVRRDRESPVSGRAVGGAI